MNDEHPVISSSRFVRLLDEYGAAILRDEIARALEIEQILRAHDTALRSAISRLDRINARLRGWRE